MAHVLYYLGISIFIIVLAFLFTKFISSKMTRVQSGKMIRVIESTKMGNTQILLFECCGRYYLVSENNNGIELLDQFDDIGQVTTSESHDFENLYSEAIKADPQNLKNKLFNIKNKYVELKKQMDRGQDYEQKK